MGLFSRGALARIIKTGTNTKTQNVQHCSRGQQHFRMRRPQSVRVSVWYMGGRKRWRKKQTGEFFPLAAVAGPLLGAVGGDVMKKNIWW